MQIRVEEVEDSLVKLQPNEGHERQLAMVNGKDYSSIVFGKLEVIIDKNYILRLK